jgi:hypothetical protein
MSAYLFGFWHLTNYGCFPAWDWSKVMAVPRNKRKAVHNQRSRKSTETL